MRHLLILTIVALAVLLALRAARAQVGHQAAHKKYPHKRTALLTGTLRGNAVDLPIAAIEARFSEHNATIIALFADGTIARVQDELRTSVSLFTPGNNAMRVAHLPFLNAMRAKGAVFTERLPVAEPADGYAVGYLLHNDELRATAPVPADDPREGNVDLIEALREANELAQRVFQRSLRGL